MLNGASTLNRLVAEREHILLLELAAWLHDIGKFCDLMIKSQSTSHPSDYFYKTITDDPRKLIKLSKVSNQLSKPDELNNILSVKSPKAADFIPANIKDFLEKTKVRIIHDKATGTHEEYWLAELIMLGLPSFAVTEYKPKELSKLGLPTTIKKAKRSDLLDGKSGWLPALLGVCHAEGHHDKQEKGKPRQQPFPGTWASSAFGFESHTVGDSANSLDPRLQSLSVAQPVSYATFFQLVREQFSHGLGDTRRPINEVTLADWSSSVAALFKSAVAAAVLDEKETEIRQWKIQREIIDHDLNWRLLRVSFDGLRFLEQAATVSDTLGRRAALQTVLDQVRELLEDTYPFGNEIYRDENGAAFVVPALAGDDAQGTKLHSLIDGLILEKFEALGEVKPVIEISEANQKAEKLSSLLGQALPPLRAFEQKLKTWWASAADLNDRCTACGVRPQGWGAPSRDLKTKAESRSVCYVCLERRGTRSRDWARSRDGQNEQEQRLWRRTIWLDEVADKNGRLALLVGRFDLSQWLSGEMVQTMIIGYDHAGAAVSKNASFARLRRVWRTTQQFWQAAQDEDIAGVINSEQKRVSIAVTNKAELQSKLGKFHAYEAESVNGRRLSVVWDSDQRCFLTADNLDAEALQKALPESLQVFEPGGYNERRKPLCTAEVDRDNSAVIEMGYVPMIPLFAEPQNFMALVPAVKAVEIVTKIANRYELEMSKVRNRLPFFLGLVFFDRRQPLFSAFDAGRRMLDQQFPTQIFKVTGNTQKNAAAATHIDHNHFKQYQMLELEDAQGQGLEWPISTVMGDGKTPDVWYPYFQVLPDASGARPTARQEQFELQGKDWVHVEKLIGGVDHVSAAPARVDWIFHDTSARRFQVGAQPAPYLEEFRRINELWGKLKWLHHNNDLTDSRLHAIVALLKAKEEMWGRVSPQYRELARAVLVNEKLDGLSEDDLTSGRLLKTFELYYQILKSRLKEEKL
jgi:hypothetical protein